MHTIVATARRERHRCAYGGAHGVRTLPEDEQGAGAVLERQGVGLRIVEHDPALPVMFQLGAVPCQRRRGEDGELLLAVAGDQSRVGERGGAVVVSLFMPSILSFLKS